MNRILRKIALWGVGCSSAFAYAYFTPVPNSEFQVHRPAHVVPRAENLRSESEGDSRAAGAAVPAALMEIAGPSILGASVSQEDQKAAAETGASSFTYTDLEVSQTVSNLYGNAAPAIDQVVRRQREKFYDYAAKVSSFAIDQSELNSAASGNRVNSNFVAQDSPQSAVFSAEPSAESEGYDTGTGNPYIKLRDRNSPGSGAEETTGTETSSGESKTERYIKQAAKSDGKL